MKIIPNNVKCCVGRAVTRMMTSASFYYRKCIFFKCKKSHQHFRFFDVSDDLRNPIFSKIYLFRKYFRNIFIFSKIFFGNIFRQDEKIFLIQFFFYDLDYVSRLPQGYSEHSVVFEHASPMNNV